MKNHLAAAALACTCLAACTTQSEAPPVNVPFAGLEGTSWQLVGIESMADAQPARRPDDSSKYILTFGAEGRVMARLDCNRGTGIWRNDISNATGGTLAFGLMAVTKALCPEPTLGEVLERQLPYVRTFIIRDGHLHMALMADGGIIEWKPAKTPR
ncbi:META domain-containing protein [Altererythrobacter sp.]|uniref:META domain-containing protein n=1 Tax=Altererythrobacter sp. TaxID=1872480 RepID=UPI003D030743